MVASVLGAIVIVGALVLFNRPGSSVSGEPYVPVERAATDGKSWGNADAPVKIIEFADFQCPFCRAFALETERMLATEFIDTGTVQLTFHDFAFLGAESRRAAEAAECAADQDHFWEFHDLVFLRQGNENGGAFSDGRLKQIARELQAAHAAFDVDGFDACLDSGRKAAVVDQSTASAANAGITQTPSFVINGKLLTGAQGIDVFRRAIRQALEAAGGGS